mgnify:CR=1 FL=1
MLLLALVCRHVIPLCYDGGMQKEELILRNRDGKRMPATLRTPETEPKGTCIVLHGLGGWKNQTVTRTIADAVARAGYSTLTFDEACGPNGLDAGQKLSTTSRYAQDLEDVIAYARSAPWFVGTLSLAGHSLGALVSQEYAAQHPDEIKKLIMVAPALSWRAYPRFILPVAFWWIITNHHRMEGPTPEGFVLGRNWILDFFGYDAYKRAGNIMSDTLVIMGERDGLVGTVRTHERYVASLPKGTLRVIKGATHNFTNEMPLLADTIKKWLT